MRKITCYRKGCNNRAQWIVPGRQAIHLCTTHMRELLPKRDIVVQQIVVGPTEFKEESEGTNGEHTGTT